MIRDEFGGYCCKKWSSKDAEMEDEEEDSEDGICKLLGLDIDRKAFELVKSDF